MSYSFLICSLYGIFPSTPQNLPILRIIRLLSSYRRISQSDGGYGYVKELPVERYFRDAKITEIYEGTSEIMKIIIGNNILNEFT